jgi:hypothetical protein
MNTNANLEAAIGALALLGTAFVLGLAALIILHARRFFRNSLHHRTRKQLLAQKD